MFLEIPYIILILWLVAIFQYGTYRTAYDEGYDAGKKYERKSKGKTLRIRNTLLRVHINKYQLEDMERELTYRLKQQLARELPFEVKTFDGDRVRHIEVSLTVLEKENEKEG